MKKKSFAEFADEQSEFNHSIGIGTDKEYTKIHLSEIQKEVISRMKGGYILFQSTGKFSHGRWHLRKNEKGGYLHCIDVLKPTAEYLLRMGVVKYVRTEYKTHRRHKLSTLGRILVKANTTPQKNTQKANALTDKQKKIIERMRKYAARSKPIEFNIFQVKLAVYDSMSNKYNRCAGSFMKHLEKKKLVQPVHPNRHNFVNPNMDGVYWQLTDWGKNIDLKK